MAFPNAPTANGNRRRMPCLARPAWPGLRCPPFVPVAIGCTLHPTRQREIAAACPASPAPTRRHAQEDAKTRRGDRFFRHPSSPHPLTHTRPAASETSTHRAARHSNQAERSSRNLRAVMIGISRKEPRFSRCPSPLTTQSAVAATAASRNLLSGGSHRDEDVGVKHHAHGLPSRRAPHRQYLVR